MKTSAPLQRGFSLTLPRAWRQAHSRADGLWSAPVTTLGPAVWRGFFYARWASGSMVGLDRAAIEISDDCPAVWRGFFVQQDRTTGWNKLVQSPLLVHPGAAHDLVGLAFARWPYAVLTGSNGHHCPCFEPSGGRPRYFG